MKKILIVDDEVDFTTDFAEVLGIFGYQAFTAGNGKNALNIIERQKPDIVLCDYRLPDMDGDKILEKSRLNYPEIKFVMITGYYDEAVDKRLRDLGADEILLKPIALADIEKLLARL